MITMVQIYTLRQKFPTHTCKLIVVKNDARPALAIFAYLTLADLMNNRSVRYANIALNAKLATNPFCNRCI
jgi:hypothetical protein